MSKPNYNCAARKFTLEERERVKDLYLDYRSINKVAAELGFSRHHVRRIVRNDIPEAIVSRSDPKEEIDSEFKIGVNEKGPVERCPSCGAMTYMPCYACRVARLAKKQGLKEDQDWTKPPVLAFELEAEEQRRYEEVRQAVLGNTSRLLDQHVNVKDRVKKKLER